MTHRSRLLPGLLALVLGTATLIATPCDATTSRIRNLGGEGDYFEDDANVLRWFGSLADYPDLAVLELGEMQLGDASDVAGDRIRNRGGAMHLQLTDPVNVGTFAMYFQTDLPEPEPGGSFSALYSHTLLGLQLGAYFRGTSYGTAANNPTTEGLQGDARYFHNYGLGLRADLSDRLYVDLAGELIHTQLEYHDAARGIADDDSRLDSGAARARAFWAVTDDVALVPVFDYLSELRATYLDILDDTTGLDAWQISTGLGANALLDPDNLLIVSVEYRKRHEDYAARHPWLSDYDFRWREFWTIRARVGIESRLLPWLTLRASTAYRRLTDEQYTWQDLEDGSRIFEYGWDVNVTVPISLGVGMHFGAFDADLVFNDEAPFSFGYLLTGADDGNTANFTSITLSYGF